MTLSTNQRRTLHALAFIAAALTAAPTRAAGTIEVTRKGYWQLEVGGAVQPANYSAYHTALEGAVNAWLSCGCPVRILQPAVLVGGVAPAPEPDGDPAPAPEPEPEPVAQAITPEGVAVSYTCGPDATAVDGRPLLGETLSPTEVCIELQPAIPVTATTWDIAGQPSHIERWTPYTWRLDLAALPAGSTTLILHAELPDGTLQTPVQIDFTIAERVPEPPPAATAVTLEWTRPTSRENGVELPPEQLWGYLVRYQRPGEDPAVVGVPGGVVTTYSQTLDPGAYTFDVAAVDTDGLQSRYSDPVTATIE